jgi:hypothetical protein
MIIIGEGVWREDCIAAIDINRDEQEVQVFPVNCSEYVPYSFDSVDEAIDAYRKAVTAWTTWMKGRRVVE